MISPLLILMLALSSAAVVAEVSTDATAAYAQGLTLKDHDPVAARQAFESADLQGHSLAAVQLGMLYADGKGVAQDDGKALGYFVKAAASGQREALYNKGLFLLEGRGVPRDLNGALASFGASAAAGSLPAHTKLADLYYFGTKGMKKDHALALPHVKVAAAANDPWACNILGTMAELGQAMERDSSAARYWFRVAAEQGHAKAQGNLGRLLRSGDPTHWEKVECYKWLKLSSLQGISMSTYQLGFHTRSLTAGQIAEGEREVANFMASHAGKGGHPSSRAAQDGP
jgi:uncharacterized protein